DVLGMGDVGDVEDPDPPQPAGADRIVHPFLTTVEPPAHPLARHEEQVLVDGDIALRRRADKPDLQRRLGRVRKVPALEPLVIPLNRVLPGEREIWAGHESELYR